MKSYKLPFLISILSLVLVVGFTVVYAASTNSVLKDPNGVPAKDGATCNTTTSSRVTIGNQASTRVLATSTNRAFARISIGDSATNTASLAFDEDVLAVLNQGVLIGMTSAGFSGTTTPSVDFGITTILPYTGSVTAITDNGTTTVSVFECVY